jgi:hypothetical protein
MTETELVVSLYGLARDRQKCFHSHEIPAFMVSHSHTDNDNPSHTVNDGVPSSIRSILIKR